MITTLFLILLLAFLGWMFSSRKNKQIQPPVYLQPLLQHRQAVRLSCNFLGLLACAGFVWKLGWETGLFAALVGLMGVGCLVVFLRPYMIIRELQLGLLYIFFLLMEIFI